MQENFFQISNFDVHLVIGASGLVGSHIFNSLKASGEEVYGTYNKYKKEDLLQLDITDVKKVNDIIRVTGATHVYVPAAEANVNYCEEYPFASYLINVNGIKNIYNAARLNNAKVIFLSSDYIFDGVKGNYAEQDLANPINMYGMHKLVCEHFLLSKAYNKKQLDVAIIRTSGVFGKEERNKNFVYQILKKLKNSEPVLVPADQIYSPTYAPELAKAAIEIARRNFVGVVNVAGSESVSRFEYAKAIANTFEYDPDDIKGYITKESLGPRRPLNSSLDISYADSFLSNKMISYKDSLQLFKKEEFDYIKPFDQGSNSRWWTRIKT